MSDQTQETQLATKSAQPSQLFQTFGDNFGVNPGQVARLLASIVVSVNKGDSPPTAEEVAACAIVCNVHNLNPFTKEIHAFRSKGKMLFAIGVDGWSKIAQRQTTMNGVEWEAHVDKDGKFYAMTCKIYRKDWALPVVVTEYLDECRRDTDPWTKSPRRMMRNRSYAQAVRMAFAIGGVMDESEADQVTDGRFSTAVLEGETQPDPTEAIIREYATKLGYNNAKLQTLRQQYDGREEYLLSFLKTEHSKKVPQPHILPAARTAAKQTRPAAQKAAELEPQQEAQTEDAQPAPATAGADFFEFDQSGVPASDDSDDIGSM